MGKQKDITQKTLEGFDEVFSDIINVLLFNGREVVSPNALTDADTHSYYKSSGEVRSQDRDVAKYWDKAKVRVAILGIENQTDIDRLMPVRVIGYDGAAYRDQLPGEPHPVVTLVLYYGHQKRWDAGMHLKEVMDIPKELALYVSDYSINLFEIAYLDDRTLEKFRSDFRILADYAVQMRKNGKYVPARDAILHPRELLEAMSALSGDARYEESYNAYLRQHPDQGRRTSMDQYLTELINEGEARGKEEGRAEMLELIRKYAETGRDPLDISDEELYSVLREGSDLKYGK